MGIWGYLKPESMDFLGDAYMEVDDQHLHIHQLVAEGEQDA